MLPDAVVELARKAPPLLLLHPPHRARELAEMLLALGELREQAFLLAAQARELVAHQGRVGSGAGDPVAAHGSTVVAMPRRVACASSVACCAGGVPARRDDHAVRAAAAASRSIAPASACST